MPTAWQYLQRTSRLTSGTAWALLTNPKTGIGTQYIEDGIITLLEDAPVGVLIDDNTLEVILEDRIIINYPDNAVIEVLVDDLETITVCGGA